MSRNQVERPGAIVESLVSHMKNDTYLYCYDRQECADECNDLLPWFAKPGFVAMQEFPTELRARLRDPYAIVAPTTSPTGERMRGGVWLG
jgi:hypothetical protein